jgi:peptidoglycan hydrolase-like protein with peptidoglycan-binding domain
MQRVTMASTRCLRWTCTLVVTAAAAFILATTSSAQAQAPATGSSSSLQAKPLPSAGWHGAPIQRPLPARDRVATTAMGASDRDMSLGAGFGRAAGSQQVRTLQRILRSLGYACGPVDGLFGPRTQASLQWFQIKHGLRPTGSADAETLRILHLRARAGAPRDAGPRPDAPASSQAPTRPANASPPANAPRAHPAATPSHHAPANAPHAHPAATPSHGAPTPQRGGQGLGVVPIALLLAAAVALVSLLLTVGWRRSWRTRVSDARARLARRLRSAPALLRHTKAAPAHSGAASVAGPRGGPRPDGGPGQS